ncbi:MAG: phage holin family protein [Burkholderiaceae bacterium]|jgi:uncharacterized membrane protein YqjE
MRDSDAEEHPPLLLSLRQAAATVIGMVHTRLSLAGIEIEEEVQRLLVLMVMALAALLFVALALLVFSLMIVLAVGEDNRILAMAILSGVYLAAGAAFAFYATRSLSRRPPLFAATLAELEKDRAALKPAMTSAPDEGSGSARQAT